GRRVRGRQSGPRRRQRALLSLPRRTRDASAAPPAVDNGSASPARSTVNALLGRPQAISMHERARTDRPSVEVPYGAWFEEERLRLAFPEGWSVRRVDPADAPEASDDAIAAAFAAPLGTPPLAELARGRRRVVIAVDDLTRPTPAHRIVPSLLGELERAGVGASQIALLIGTASHRPPVADEIVRKVGPEVAARCRVRVHD